MKPGQPADKALNDAFKREVKKTADNPQTSPSVREAMKELGKDLRKK